ADCANGRLVGTGASRLLGGRDRSGEPWAGLIAPGDQCLAGDHVPSPCTKNVVGPRGVEPLDARRSVSQSAGLQPAERKGTRAGGPIRTDTETSFRLAASAVGLRQRISGATGPIRTDTARCLKPLPPTSWATVALVRTAGFEPALFTTSR